VQGNAGVAVAVARIPFSIGYIERSYLHGPALADAAIRNQAGHYSSPAPAAIAADAAQKPGITPTDFSIVNEPGPDSYPISGYSWALLYTRQTTGAGAGQSPELAHPQRPDLRRRPRLRPPAAQNPAARPGHAPADNRPDRNAPAELSQRAAGA
jgi:hypothetical protein